MFYITGHGQCTGLEQCTCDEGWSSENCGTANCTSLDDCSSQGQCVAPDSCYCYDGFEGRNCSQPISDNLNAPAFNESDYYCTVSEKAKIGTSLMDVYATDADEGKNGDIHYVLEPYGAEIVATSYLVVDTVSGRVTLLSPISRNLLSSDNLLVWVRAVDGGVPPREAKAQLHIRVLDVNDHCPVFHSPDSGSIHFVNMSTEVNTTALFIEVTDDDFGDNGEVAISFAASTDNVVRDTFDIDPTSGRISSLVSPLTAGKFDVVILATDGATNPCSKQMSLTIQVLPPDVEPLTTTSTPAPTTTTTATTSSPVTTTTTTSTLEPKTTASSDVASPGMSTVSLSSTTTTSSQKMTTYFTSKPKPTSEKMSTSKPTTQTVTKEGQVSVDAKTTTATESQATNPVTSTLASQTTPQRHSVDSPTNDSSRSTFIILGSVFALVVLVGVLVIVILRFQVVSMKAQIEEMPAGIQPRWHTRFNDRFNAQREWDRRDD